MPTVRSGNAQLFYEISGDGPDVVLLHPFPLNHHFWTPVAELLSTRHRLIVPDLRAHGDSDLGEGPATMQKLADDLALLCREVQIKRASFARGFHRRLSALEFWRRHREQVAALVLANTRAGAETAESKVNRLASAEKVLREGTDGFIDEMLPKVLSTATRTNRPDIVDAARRMMQKMSADDIAGVSGHG